MGVHKLRGQPDILCPVSPEGADPLQSGSLDSYLIEALDEDTVGDMTYSAERSKRMRAAVSPLSRIMWMISLLVMRAISVL